MLPLLATLCAAFGFTVAFVLLAFQVRNSANFMFATWYIMLIALANALFRYYTAYHRVFNLELPQPETTNVALVLQVSLAAALVLIAALGKIRRDVAREAATV